MTFLSPGPALEDVRARVLAWYRENARVLPWRTTRDPYAIWVSEVMLQQTRVDTVVPYYERFLSRWPTLADLALADPVEVRAAWSGLGYYRRAQAMLDAARLVVDRHGGVIPSELETLLALPGFGPYTAGAVTSIAFDRPAPAVDGNVTRVLARIAGIEGDVSRGAPARRVREVAARLAPGESPGQLTQALIELGALVCTRNPSCGSCPVRLDCVARREGAVDFIPPPRARREPKVLPLTALVLEASGSVALEVRPAGGLFGGFWSPPLLEGDHDPAAARSALARDHALDVPLESRGSVVHLLTHRRLVARVLSGPLPADIPTAWRAVPLTGLDQIGVPSFAVKLLRAGVPPARLPDRLPGRNSRERRAPQPELPWAGSEGGPR